MLNTNPINLTMNEYIYGGYHLLRSNHNVEPIPKTTQRIEVQESKTFGLPIKKKGREVQTH